MNTDFQEATEQFTRVMSRFFSNDALIGTFVRLTKDGLTSITPQLAESNLAYAKTTFPEFCQKNIILDESFANNSEVHQGLGGEAHGRKASVLRR